MSGTSCDRITKIVLADAEGVGRSDEDGALVDEHLATCSECRHELQALRALHMVDGEESHFPIDEVTRRRRINDVLAHVDAPWSGVEETERMGWGRRLILVAASVLALVVSGALVARHGPSWIPGAQQWRLFEDEPTQARILLTSGVPQSELGRLQVSRTLAEDQIVDTGDGESVLELTAGVRVLLAPQTRVQLTELRPNGAEIALSRGAIQAAVVPGAGTRFAVETHAGRIEVTGTVFAVEARADDVELRVVRGSVRVHRAGRPARDVKGFEALALKRDEARRLSPLEEDESLAASQRLSVLGEHETARHGAIAIWSSPQEAMVAVDGQLLGRTPLGVEIATGQHAIELRVDGEVMLREQVQLGAGELLERRYELPTVDEVPSDEAADAESSLDVAPAARRRVMRPRAKPSVETLLEDAQLRRTARAWPAAAKAYGRLIAAYPDSSAGRAALVSLAQIELEHRGAPGRALSLCERYLALDPAGSIAREASLCKIAALAALGRAPAELSAIDDFLAHYPQAVQAAELRKRRDALQADPVSKPR